MITNIKVFSNQEEIENNDLIDYLNICGYKLNFVYDNVFKFYKDDPINIAKQYYNIYQANVFHVKRKFLCDSFLYESVKTPFCFTKIKHNFIMTKGTNKIIAYAVNGMSDAPIIIIAQEEVGYTISSMEELYDILRMFDRSSNSFVIKLDDNLSYPAIHYIESSKTIDNWFIDDPSYKDYASLTEIDGSSTIVLFGSLIADGKNLNVIHDTRTISDCNELIQLSNNYSIDVNYFLYSNDPFLIDEKYLGYIQYNFFLNRKIKFGFNKQKKDFFVYNRNNQSGVLGYIPLPCPINLK